MLSALILAGSALAATALEAPAVTEPARRLLDIKMKSLSFPEGDERHNARVSDSAVVDGLKYELKYNILLRSGDAPVEGGPRFGATFDINGDAVPDPGGPFGEYEVSVSTDFASLMAVGDKVYSISHFESTPAASYLTTLSQDPKTGDLTVDSTKPMDWASFGGLWVPCAGSVTPWNTHFGSEEYEPDARFIESSEDFMEWPRVDRIAKYLALHLENTTLEEMRAAYKPYRYGYAWEARVGTDGEIDYQVKHYAMGRLAIELPYTMPDQKTVYITDDGTNVMLGVYVASKAADLTCGSLYAAKFTQNGLGDFNAGSFTVEWVPVGGEACDSDIQPLIDTVSFSDMFDAVDGNEDGTCPATYTSINAQAGFECLRLKDNMEMAASRLEFRRYAAMLGATTEFSKWEGITFDPTRNLIYTAMSSVRRGMEDSAKDGDFTNPEYDLGGANSITVPYNDCGCVYKMEVDPVTYLATTMNALICGNTETNTDELNFCDKEAISQPDNVAYVLGHDGLIIGEDTDGHQNDVMWYYDMSVTPATLTRFLSTPYGSETTSPYFYPDINGFSYIMAVIQHPYGENDKDKIDEAASTGKGAYFGYIGPFKTPKSLDPVGSECGGECAADYRKCNNTRMATKSCCTEGSVCVEKSKYYAQCLPAGKVMSRVARGDWTGRTLYC